MRLGIPLAIAVHVGLFVGLGLTLVFAIVSLIDTGGLGSILSIWKTHLDLVSMSFYDSHRLPFALCVYAFGLLVPAACAVWSTRPLLAGQPVETEKAVINAMACSAVGIPAFVIAVTLLIANAPFRADGRVTSNLIWYGMVIVVWGGLHLLTAAISHRIVISALRRRDGLRQPG